MKDRSPIPIRYPICSAVATATDIQVIDKILSARAMPAAKGNTHRGNKDENLKELTERDAGKKANDYK
jgi:hypothetical protein